MHRLHLRLVQKQHTLITHRQCKRISKRGISQVKRCAVCHNRACAGEGIGRHRIRVEDKFARADGDTVCRRAIPRKATLTGFGHGAAVGHHRHLYFQRCARSHFNYAAINLERVVVGSVFKIFHHIVTSCDRKLGVVPGADVKPFTSVCCRSTGKLNLGTVGHRDRVDLDVPASRCRGLENAAVQKNVGRIIPIEEVHPLERHRATIRCLDVTIVRHTINLMVCSNQLQFCIRPGNENRRLCCGDDSREIGIHHHCACGNFQLISRECTYITRRPVTCVSLADLINPHHLPKRNTAVPIISIVSHHARDTSCINHCDVL